MGERFVKSLAIGEDYLFDAVDFVTMPHGVRERAQGELWSVIATANLGVKPTDNACVVFAHPQCGFIVTVWDNVDGGFIHPTNWFSWHGTAFENFATRIRHALPSGHRLDWPAVERS
jgi:hypothetical protein